MSKYNCYIFDLYGTLVDIHTNETKKYLWEKMAMFYSMNGATYDAAEFKLSYRAECKKEVERLDNEYSEIDIDRVFEELYLSKGVKADIKLIHNTEVMFRTISTEYIKLYPGAKEMLLTLKKAGKKLVLLSNAQYSFTMPELIMLGIRDCFDNIYISSSIGRRKPGYEFYGTMVRRESLNVQRSIMVGNDIECDIIGAKKIGLDTFYINSNISPKNDDIKKSPASYSCKMDKAYKKLLETLDEE